jgi:hypothetical protein
VARTSSTAAEKTLPPRRLAGERQLRLGREGEGAGRGGRSSGGQAGITWISVQVASLESTFVL